MKRFSLPVIALWMAAASPGTGTAATLPDMYGSVVASDAWDPLMPKSGLYMLPSAGGNELRLVFTGPEASGGGVAVDGIYYATSYASSLFGVSTTITGYDLGSGEGIMQAWGNDGSTVAVDLTHDPTTGNVYGIFFTPDLDGYCLATIEYADFTVSVTPVANLQGEWGALAADPDGRLFAISKQCTGEDGSGCTGSTLVELDKTTGEIKRTIGQTGVAPEYFGSAAIEHRTHTMYWTVKLADGTGALYSVDTTDGKATRVCRFANNEQVTGLFIPIPEVEPDAPGEIRDLTVDFPEGSLAGTISFTLPSTLYDGSMPDEAEVDYEITVNDEKVAFGRRRFGTRVSVPLQRQLRGNCHMEIYACNSIGAGPKQKLDVFVGPGTPELPELYSTLDGAKVSLEWGAVTESTDGGYLDPAEVTYTVTRQPDGVVLAKNLTATTFSTELPDPAALTLYYYEVEAMSREVGSGTTRTVAMPRGNAIPPYAEDFSNPDSFQAYTVVDANADNLTWRLYEEEARAPFAMKNDMDDWLMSPPLMLEAGRAYVVSFDAHGFLDFAKERLEVRFGDAPEPEAMSGVLLEPTDIGEAPVRFTGYIVPEKTGKVYIGFHSVSPVNMFYLFVDNILVEAEARAGAPDMVTDIKAVPDTEGKPRLEISFNAPATDYAGEALESLDRIEVLRQGKEQPVKVFASPAPGERLSFVDEEASEAEAIYTFIPYNAAGEGKHAGLSTYLGMTYPAASATAVLADTTDDGMVTLSWERVTTDCNGYAVNPDKIRYGVFTVANGVPTPVATDIKGTSHTFRAVAKGAQTFLQCAVIPYTDRGPGEATLSKMIPVGTAYRNYEESFADGELSTIFMRETVNGFALWHPTTDGYPGYVSADGDNGYLLLDAYAIDDCSDIITGKISVGDMKSPALTFSVYNTFTENGGPSHNSVEVWGCAVGDDFKLLKRVEMHELGDLTGWYNIAVPLDEFAGKDVQLKFRGTAASYIYVLIDRLRVRPLFERDLKATDMMSLASVPAGSKFTVAVEVTNEGTRRVTDYSVDLYADGVKAGSEQGLPLEPDGKCLVPFNCVMPVLAEQSVEYTARVVYADDADKGNNEVGPIEVNPIISVLPVPRELEGSATAEGTALTWQAPDMSTARPDMVEESFESGASFAHEFGDWTFVDADGIPVGGVLGTEIPGIEPGQTCSSFFVFDATDETVYDHMFSALTGKKYLASLFRFNGGKVDDWAISPRLDPRAQTVSFYAASFMYAYPEAIEVLYSTGGKDLKDFKLLASYPKLDADWTQIVAELPEGTNYFAIRSVGEDSFMLMIDDVSYIPATGPTSVRHESYNVYRDGLRLNSEPVKATAWTDATAGKGNYSYRVTAVHNLGESAGSNEVTVDTSGVVSVSGAVSVYVDGRRIIIRGADGEAVNVAAADGRNVFAGEAEGTLSVDVEPGVYAVGVGGKAWKVLVR